MSNRNIIAALMVVSAVAQAEKLNEVALTPVMKEKLSVIFKGNVPNDLKVFDATAGLYGVVVPTMKNGQPAIVYLDKRSDHMIVGDIFNVAAGQSITTQAAAQFIPQTEMGQKALAIQGAVKDIVSKESQKVIQKIPVQIDPAQLQNLPQIVFGPAAPATIYAVIDTTCEPCRRMVRDVWMMQNTFLGKVQFRFIVTSMGKPAGTAGAAFAYGSKNQMRALFDVVSGKANLADKQTVSMGVPSLEAVIEKLPKIKATPTIVVKSANGSSYGLQGYSGPQALMVK